MKNIYEVQRSNKIKSAIVVVLFALFVAAATYILARAFGAYSGYEPGGLGFVGIALVVSGVMSFVGYYTSDKIVLAISGARPANRKTDFTFYTVAQNIAIGAGIPEPKLYVIPDSAPNAFVTGRDPKHAVVCATTGILEKLDRTELEGVIAHELSHIGNYDTRFMSIIAILAGIIVILADFSIRGVMFGGRDRNRGGNPIIMVIALVLVILAPIMAQLIKLAISRRREFLADASAAAMTKYPEGLASALELLATDTEPLEAANKATSHLYIVNPLKNHYDAVGWFAHMFATHPPVAERIRALRAV